MKAHCWRVLLVLCGMAWSLSAHACVDGKLGGVVRDSSRAVVPSATIIVTNAETGINREARTSARQMQFALKYIF